MATPITDVVLRLLDPYAIACKMCREGQYEAGSRRMAEIIDDIRKLLAPVEGARADLVIETCDQGHKYGKLSDASHGCPYCLREGLARARSEHAYDPTKFRLGETQEVPLKDLLGDAADDAN